jgi:putative peptidoglycan lipid II flippase
VSFGLVRDTAEMVRTSLAKMRYRWRGLTSEHRSIFLGLISVGVFSIVGKLVMGLKEVAVAWRFGVSAEVDAYLFVFNLASWPVAIWFSTLSVIVIPLEARLRQDSPERLTVFRTELLGITSFLGIVLVLAARFGLPWVVRQPVIGLPPGTLALAMEIIPRLSWLPLPGVLIGLMSTWMMSDGRYSNTILEGVPAVCILLAVLAFSSIQAMVWATLVGTILQLAVLNQFRRYSVGSFSLSSPAWAPFWRGFGVMILGQALMALTTLVDQFFAAGLGEGAISSLGYASRLLSLVNGIVATAVARATLPVFSRLRAGGGATGTRDLAMRWAGILAVIGVLSALLGWLIAPEVVRVLFQRGTFTSADAQQVSMLSRYGLFQLPFFFASLVFVSLHSSRGHYGVLLAASALGLSVKIAVVWWLKDTLGVGALIISTAAMYAVNMSSMLLVNSRIKA